jgi:hypothetical protein
VIIARPLLASLLFAVAVLACDRTKLIPGRCEKAADCSGGLVCDDHKTCVPPTPGPSPCSTSAECGPGYACDNLQWCVCLNKGFSADNDPCADGRLPTYRGVETDGGTGGSDGGDGRDGGDGGDGGFRCMGDDDCSGSKPFCLTSTGACVECTATAIEQCNADATKPICDTTTDTCVPCTTDAQCVAKMGSPDPGVCMFHQDGHCATDMESVYVKFSNVCPAPTDQGAGSKSSPFCTVANALAALGSRRLVLIRGDNIAGGVTIQSIPRVSLVGQQGAIMTAGSGQSGIQATGADVYVRGLKILGISMATTIGIIADGNATIRLDGVEIDNMPQGGLRVTGGAGYDVINSIFAGNGGVQVSTGLYIGGALLDPGAGKPSRFAFNTVVNNKREGVTCAATAQIIEATMLAGNLGGGGTPDYTGCTLDSTSKALGTADPMLTPTYRITATSPCYNFLASLSAGAPNHDIDAIARPQGSAYDCGASELKP